MGIEYFMVRDIVNQITCRHNSDNICKICHKPRFSLTNGVCPNCEHKQWLKKYKR